MYTTEEQARVSEGFGRLRRLWESGASAIPAKTSGSTGFPKEILLPRAIVTQSARRSIKHFALTRHSSLHSCLSPDTVGGKMVLVRALECGARFSCEPPSNRPLADFGPDDHLTMVSVVPSQMIHLLERHRQGTLPAIDHILVGGAPVPKELRQRIVESGLRVWESYGMTETASHVAMRPIADPQAPFSPLPGIEVVQDKRGCAMILGVGDGPIVTNDIIVPESDGRFQVVGREDNVIISGGRKIIPEMLEERFSQLPFPTAITSMSDAKWGEHPVVVYVCQDSDAEESLEQVKACCATITPRWMRPREGVRLRAIPMTRTGKVDRRRLRTEVQGATDFSTL